MGHLKYLVEGGKEAIERYVSTPFHDEILFTEMAMSWQFWEGTYQKRFKLLKPDARLGQKISAPHSSVLYILGHSGQGADVLADNGGNTMYAQALADWLTRGESPLPMGMLAVKIWACFPGSNGLALTLKNYLNERGYRRTIVVGYTAAVGGPIDKSGSIHKHMWEVDAAGERGDCLGRGKRFQTIYA